ncbi:MAG: MBL fold metallo-hydrolase [Flavobacteriales bacterium]|nr:MBL fold metallo-hydrolase [Flavobacteriales bacterium]
MKTTIETTQGHIEVNTLGHAGLLLVSGGKNIYADPYSEAADYAGMPKADVLLVTHDHYDHYDPEALRHILTPDTVIVSNADVASLTDVTHVLSNGDEVEVYGMKIKAVPAYNIEHRNDEGNHFHPRGVGNGYLLDIDGYRFYIAGDTENIPEMAALKGSVDVAFLPKNLPYTMSDDMWVDAVRMIEPRVVYPIHYFELDLEALKEKLSDIETIEIRK